MKEPKFQAADNLETESHGVDESLENFRWVFSPTRLRFLSK
jgi:hypothetical protein